MVSCDSACDLSPEMRERYAIQVTSMYIHQDGKVYRDGIDISPDSIYDTVGSDAAFADLSAVKNGSYYKVPGTPWNWLNSPPTVNQVLGMQWLPRLLYPEQYDNDLHKTVAGYFKTFYGYDLSESEFNEIAANAQPKA